MASHCNLSKAACLSASLIWGRKVIRMICNSLRKIKQRVGDRLRSNLSCAHAIYFKENTRICHTTTSETKIIINLKANGTSIGSLSPLSLALALSPYLFSTKWKKHLGGKNPIHGKPRRWLTVLLNWTKQYCGYAKVTLTVNSFDIKSIQNKINLRKKQLIKTSSIGNSFFHLIIYYLSIIHMYNGKIKNEEITERPNWYANWSKLETL